MKRKYLKNWIIFLIYYNFIYKWSVFFTLLLVSEPSRIIRKITRSFILFSFIALYTSLKTLKSFENTFDMNRRALKILFSTVYWQSDHDFGIRFCPYVAGYVNIWTLSTLNALMCCGNRYRIAEYTFLFNNYIQNSLPHVVINQVFKYNDLE